LILILSFEFLVLILVLILVLGLILGLSRGMEREARGRRLSLLASLSA
jgi:uncharacterized membrane protein